MTKATLYINNLNEKPSPNTTRAHLQKIFHPYGDIINIIIKTKIPLKGQLFITFKSSTSAVKAQRELNGVKLLDRNIKVTFAKDDSILYYKSVMSSDEFESYIKTRSKKRKADNEEHSTKRIKLIKSQVPNKTLLLQDLSSTITKEDLVSYFSQFNGFIDLRLIKLKKLSFIEFIDIQSSQHFMNSIKDGKLQHFQNDNNESSFISFAK